MKNNVVARKLVNVYGFSYHIELRKERNFEGRTFYRLYNVYDVDVPSYEEPRGFTVYFNLDEAITALEKVSGVEFAKAYRHLIFLKANFI